MADLEELCIKVTVTAEAAEKTLDDLAKKVQGFGRSVGQKLKLDVDTSSAIQGGQALDTLAAKAGEAKTAINALTGEPMYKVNITTDSSGYDAIMAKHAEMQRTAQATQEAMTQSAQAGQEAISQAGEAAAQALKSATEQGEEAARKAAEQGTEAAREMGEVAQETAGALHEAGDAGADAGRSVKKGADEGGTAMAGMTLKTKAAAAATDILKKAWNGLKSAISGLLATAAISFVTGLVDKLIHARERQQELLEEEARAAQEAAQAEQERLDAVGHMADDYETLSRKAKLSEKETESLLDIHLDIAGRYAKIGDGIDAATGKTASWAEKMALVAQHQAGIVAQAKETENVTARQTLFDAKDAETGKTIAGYYQDIATAKSNIKLLENSPLGDAAMIEGLSLDEWKNVLGELQAEFAKVFQAPFEQFTLGAQLDKFVAEAKAAGKEVNEALLAVLKTQGAPELTGFSDFWEASQGSEAYARQIVALCTNPEISAGLETLREQFASVKGEFGFSPDEASEAQETYNAVVALITAGLQELTDMGPEAAEGIATAIADMSTGVVDSAQAITIGLSDMTNIMKNAGIAATETGSAVSAMGKSTADAMGEAAVASAETGAAMTSFDGKVRSAKEQVQALAQKVGNTTDQARAIASWKNLRQEYERAQKSGKDTSSILSRMTGVMRDMGRNTTVTAGNMGDMDKSMADLEEGVNAAGAELQGEVSGMLSNLAMLRANLIAGAVMSGIDMSGPIADIEELMDWLRDLSDEMNKVGIKAFSSGSGRGGGSGGKRDDADARAREAERAAEEAARAAEQARKDAIRADYDYADHRRHMNEITLTEYITLLEQIRTKHQLTAEEIMENEERVFDARKELADERAGKVDTLAEGVVTALENRYQKMLDAETENLDASRKAWQDWADESTAAIQAQIDALDALSDTEDREAKDAKELRKIAKLQQEVQFEQDDYNRAKLQEQLQAAIDARADRLRKQDISDQKDALQKQKEAIRDEADRQVESLDEQQTQLEKAYEERMKQSALEAEAQKLMMSSTQSELLDLIGSYAEEYNATGKTLGEKWADGFMTAVGNLETWFAAFNEKIEAVQASVAQDALATSASFYSARGDAAEAAKSVVVNQTNTFAVPVESPSDTARRVAQANEDLGLALLGVTPYAL